MEKITFEYTDITDGFWRRIQQTVSNVSIYNIYKRFSETGRFDAMKCSREKTEIVDPHIFWDSDIAKWIESLSYIIEKEPHADLEAVADEVIDIIEENREESGYFNCCYLSKFPEKKFTDRTDHELYCAGHLIEAAIAYYNSTGKRKLLDIMEKYVDYIYKVFFIDKSAAFTTPGHEEIELALVKLYRLTNNKKYLDLAEFFIDSRGQKNEREYNGVDHKYSQSHLPVRKQKTAEGHCVRAGYLYSAMADIAKIENDEELFAACRSIFDDIISKKMYITGGTGSAARGEAFTISYDLPNLTAYSESCSALALAWFAARMLLIEPDSKYSDTVERIIYNNGLSGISLDGKSFFYVNPLEIRTELLNRNTSQANTSENLPITGRLEVFDCSCCPPNITRFISSIADFMYTYQEDEVFVHQYIMSKTQTEHFIISQETDYPNSGRIKITAENIGKIALRIPFWCREFEIFLNGARAEYNLDKGYAYINLNGAYSEIELNLKITTTLVYPSPKIHDCKGTVAVMRGPVVYCAEGIDNEFSVSEFVISGTSEFSEEYSDYFGTYVLYADGKVPRAEEHLYSFDPPEYEQAKIKLIPYFGFANRGQSDMEIYLLK